MSSIFSHNPPTPDPRGPDVLWLGDTPLHESEATNHLLLVGTTGSGKTTLLRLFLQNVIPQITPGSDRRALFSNPKQDFYPILRGMAPNVDVITLDPFDSRSCSWDAQKDVFDVRTAIQLVYTLFADVPGSQAFFANAVRHIGYGVIQSFILSEVAWTLGDLFRVLRSHDLIYAVLKKHDYTAPIYDQYFSDPKLAMHVIASIAARLLPFEPIVAAWEKAERSISLSEWSTSPMVLILPHSHIGRAATDAINRCIFKTASDITLNQPDSFTRRSYYVLDELSDLPKMDGLVSLMKMGRSAGACCCVGFQSVSGLRDKEKYGREFADELLGQVGSRFIGRLECPETAEWASKLIGDQEVESISRSRTFTLDSSSSSETVQSQTRRAVLPGEFLTIPPCSAEDGLSGYFMTRSAGTHFATLDADRIFRIRLYPRSDEPDFVPRPPSDQLLHHWTPEEAARFGAVSSALSQASESKDRTLTAEDINELIG